MKRPNVSSPPHRTFNASITVFIFFFKNHSANLVDENLYYKGVNKHDVESARLNKSTTLTDPSDAAEESRVQERAKPTHPPYLFSSGDTLLALTRKHNV